MLLLNRRIGQSVQVDLPDGRAVVVKVVKVGGGQVKLAFSAPHDVRIWRTELLTRPTAALAAVPLLLVAAEPSSLVVWLVLGGSFTLGWLFGLAMGWRKRRTTTRLEPERRLPRAAMEPSRNGRVCVAKDRVVANLFSRTTPERTRRMQ